MIVLQSGIAVPKMRDTEVVVDEGNTLDMGGNVGVIVPEEMSDNEFWWSWQ